MKTLRFILLIIVLALMTFFMIKSIEQHYHVGHQEDTSIPVLQK